MRTNFFCKVLGVVFLVSLFGSAGAWGQNSANKDYSTYEEMPERIVIRNAHYFNKIFYSDIESNFRDVDFISKANFEEARFDSIADFGFTNFKSGASFKGANFKSGANFGFSNFKSSADFGFSNFESSVNFQESRFESSANFIESHFSSSANFIESYFTSDAYFKNANFSSESYFQGVRFKSSVDFKNATFDSTADFIGASFDSTADFIVINFNSIADFSEAHFKSMASFGSTTFSTTANFESTRFDSITDFADATFSTTANFQKAIFNGECNFNSTTLPSTLDFRNITKIKVEIDFTTARLDSTKKTKCLIFLTGTDISKVKINMQLFEIGFTDDERYEQRASVYEKLLAKFKQEGFEESYQLLDIEYRRYKLTHDGRWFLNLLQTYWWNYGYNKEWTVLWTLVLLLCFTAINLCRLRRLQSGIYKLEFVIPILRDVYLWKIERRRSPEHSHWKAALSVYAKYVLATLLYTSMIFFRLKIEFEKSNIRKHPGLFIYALIIYIFGLVCTGFIANVIFTK